MDLKLLSTLPEDACMRIGFNPAIPGITVVVSLKRSTPLIERVQPNVLASEFVQALIETVSLEALPYDGELTFIYALDGEVTVYGHILGLGDKDFNRVAERFKPRFEQTMQTALGALRSVLEMVAQLIAYHQSNDPTKGEYTFLQPVHPWFTTLMREFVSVVKTQYAPKTASGFVSLTDHQPVGEA